jgi:diguanylate cyclase (GGDEF)-like protein
MQSKFRSNLIAWSALIATVLFAVGVMTYKSITALIEDIGNVNHTRVVIETLAETFSLLQDVQGSQRGFVITGQDEYLKPYYAALPQLEKSIELLRILTADNGSQQQRLASLETIIAKRLSRARMIINIRRKSGFVAAQKIVLSAEGRRNMSIIRARIEQMEAEERRLLQLRNAEVQSSSLLALVVSFSGLILVVGIVLIMLLLVRRESLRRMEVEAGLETSNLTLQDSMRALERLTREMTIIATLAEMLQSCRTTDEAYHIIERTLPQILPEVTATLGLINASQNLVEVVLKVPADASAPDALFSPDNCWALRRGHFHRVQHVHSEVLCPHLANAGLTNTQDEGRFGSMLCLPLAAHGATLGVLTLLAAPVEAFSETDQRVAYAVAEHISLALANLNLQETLRTQSIRDPLTGLFNRRYLEASFERELARAERHQHALSVMMIDIDFFKKFNDTYGHEAGDLLLKGFGDILQSHNRSEDTVCRYGGEEFTILMPEAALELAVRRADELRAGAAELRIEYHRQKLPGITISVGVAAFPLHGSCKEELLQAADAALYCAKRTGRDRIVTA